MGFKENIQLSKWGLEIERPGNKLCIFWSLTWYPEEL